MTRSASLVSTTLVLLLLTHGADPAQGWQVTWSHSLAGFLQRVGGAGGAAEHLAPVLGVERILKVGTEVVESRNDSSSSDAVTCAKQLVRYSEGIVKREPWALQMLDASSKPQSGLMTGNIRNLGMYDECVDALSTGTGMEIRGRHCMYYIAAAGATLPLELIYSVCLPAGCDADDLNAILNRTINDLDIFKHLGKIDAVTATCSRLRTEPLPRETIATLSVLGLLVSALLACTAADVAGRALGHESGHGLVGKMAKFSLYTNGLHIINKGASSGTIHAVQGIRSITMAWILFGHQYVTSLFGAFVNTADIPDWIASWTSLTVLAAPFAVDTFFAISGFLLAYLFFRDMSSGTKKFNIIKFYTHRYIRLTPVLLAVLFISTYVVPHMGSGALWDNNMDLGMGSCSKRWWTYLLYAHNFINLDNNCLGHLWYMAVDMQLFWFSPMLLYPLLKRPRIGLVLWLLSFVLSLAIPSTLIAVNKYETGIAEPNVTFDQVFDSMQHYYIVPHCRAAPWLIGFLFGYETAVKNLNLKKWHFIAGWAATTISILFATLGTKVYTNKDYVYNAAWEAFFTPTSRAVWGFGVAWIIYACSQDCAGPINKLLSHRIFIPFARLSYCFYLTHIVIQFMVSSSIRSPTYFSDFNEVLGSLASFGLTLVVSFFFSLVFETPVLILERMLTSSGKKLPFIHTNGNSSNGTSNGTNMRVPLVPPKDDEDGDTAEE